MDKAKLNIPVIFQKLNEYDDRFMRVKIWLMHTGRNYNGSSFDRESVERAIPSLANTPILGYIESNMYGDDFSDHREVVVKKDGKYKSEYIGQAFGVIPQDNNAKFENRVGDDGVEREYLTCEGLIWQKWETPTEIINSDLVKSQSMELHDDYEGHLDDSGIFHFTGFKFFGACILGSGVSPAMNNATIEKVFAVDTFHKEIQNKMEEFKVVFSKYQQSISNDIDEDKDKEDKLMHVKLQELLAKYSLTEDKLTENFNVEDYGTEEDLETVIAEIAEGLKEIPEPEVVEPTVVTEPEVVEPVVVPVVGDNFEAENLELKGELDKLKQEFEAYKTQTATEIDALSTFKNTTLAAQRKQAEDALFEQFSTQLTEDEMSSVKGKASTMEVSDIETALYAIVGKKTAKFSKSTKETEVVKVKLDQDKKEDLTGYNHILEKHLK